MSLHSAQDLRKVTGVLDEGCVKESGLPVKEAQQHWSFPVERETAKTWPQMPWTVSGARLARSP